MLKRVESRPLSAAGRDQNARFNEEVTAVLNNAGGRPYLINLVDLLNDVYSKNVFDLFKKGNLHRNIGVILNAEPHSSGTVQ